MQKRLLAALLLCVCLLGAALNACTDPTPTPSPTPDPSPPEPKPDALRGAVLSVGKADATLLWGDGFAVLIDAGESEDADKILAFLARRGIRRLDALILSHYDKDHVGGAAGVLRGIEVGAIYGTYQTKESAEYDAYLTAASEAGLSPVIVRETTTLTFSALSLSLLPPKATEYGEKESNNSSLFVRAVYGDTALLFAGDAQEARIAELNEGDGLECDFLKAPYHGSPVENLPHLLSLSRPRYAALTCSQKNPEDAGKVRMLEEAGATVYLTRCGNVYLYSDGKTLTAGYTET